jgi:cyclopropane-fatty-acyl-phospholipid synthase
MNFWEILLLKVIKKFSYGSIQIEFSDGYIENIKAKKPGPKAMLKINKPNAAKEIIQGGSVAFAESYINKDISTDNLTNLIHYCALNNDQAESTFNISILKKIIHKVFHYKNKNTKNQAKKNISFHYDLGNKFYEYWLDKTMTYSSAIFNNKSIELEVAQNNKYKKLAELSAIKNGDQILEIGCGWGGFAEFIGNNYDCNLTAVTISKEQYEYTKKRIFDANLSHKIEVLLCDYRNITGKFDKIVSIEMFEAVGKQYWNTFFKKIENILKPKGSISLQLITIDDNIYDVYKTNPDFIQKYIFPGGMLPSDKILKELINKTSLKINSIDSFSKDYAKTLNIWNKEFNKKWDKIEKLGFDENFKLLWNYYLSYCEGGFLSKNIDLKQIKLSLD